MKKLRGMNAFARHCVCVCVCVYIYIYIYIYSIYIYNSGDFGRKFEFSNFMVWCRSLIKRSSHYLVCFLQTECRWWFLVLLQVLYMMMKLWFKWVSECRSSALINDPWLTLITCSFGGTVLSSPVRKSAVNVRLLLYSSWQQSRDRAYQNETITL